MPDATQMLKHQLQVIRYPSQVCGGNFFQIPFRSHSKMLSVVNNLVIRKVAIDNIIKLRGSMKFKMSPLLSEVCGTGSNSLA